MRFRSIPSQVQRIAVGAGTLTFSDGNNGTFTYTVNGITQTKSITRQVFGVLPTCTWGALANLALATNYQDLWWAAPAESESGWGINFTHQGDVIFATWFTYDFDGAALPMSATLDKTGAGRLLGKPDPHVRAGVLRRSVQSQCRDANGDGHGDGDVRERQRGELLLSGQRWKRHHDADQGDHAPGVPRPGTACQ